MSTDLASALQRLANYRSHNSRASKDVFENGVVIFKQNALSKLGDESACFRHRSHYASFMFVLL